MHICMHLPIFDCEYGQKFFINFPCIFLTYVLYLGISVEKLILEPNIVRVNFLVMILAKM